MISNFSIQKVQERIDVVEIVGQFIQLKKRGANWLGNCPFHNEKSPSFTVSQAKGIYKCFGCGKAGNGITFIQEHEKLTYPESIRWLAKFYNMELEETTQSPEKLEQQKVDESLRIINTFAASYFAETLWQTTEGKDIGYSYCKERNLLDETIKKFGIGYSLENRTSFLKAALDKGYQQELLLKCSLINDKGNGAYDNYSGRIIFPIHNVSGKVLGFGARILKKNDKAPKYINTQQNEIYNKSHTLYGIYFSKNEISKQNECYLVEGYTDVISLHQAGVQNVVASSGTSLTVEQLKLIKRYTKNLTIIYDGDAAGIKAALRGLDMAIEEGLNVQLVLLPESHDPDSYVSKVGASEFTTYINENKKDIILFKLETSLKEAGNDSVKKAELINEIAEIISKINKVEEFTKQQDYIKRCAQLLHIDEAGLITLVNKRIREKINKPASQNYSPQNEQEYEPNIAPDFANQQPQDEALHLLQKNYAQEKALIKNLLDYGPLAYDDKNTIAKYIQNKISTDDKTFENQNWEDIYQTYFNYVETFGAYPEQNYFTYHPTESVRNSSIEALYNPYEVSKNWKLLHQIDVPNRQETFMQDVESNLLYFSLRKLKNIKEDYLNQLDNANNNAEEAVVLMQVIKQIIELIQSLTKGKNIIFDR